MSKNDKNDLRSISARSLLLIAVALLLLLLANLQSRRFYPAPNLSYPFSILCVYCFLAEIGLLKLKKWALLLLFLPGILLIVADAGSIARVPMPWALINYAVLAMLIGFPVYMLRYWKGFEWR
jgi:hypothetical protein